MLRIKRIPGIWQLQNLEQSLNSLVRGRQGKAGRGKKARAAPKFQRRSWDPGLLRLLEGNEAIWQRTEVWDQVGPLRVSPHPVLSLGAVAAGMEADIPVTYVTGSQRAAKTLAVNS